MRLFTVARRGIVSVVMLSLALTAACGSGSGSDATEAPEQEGPIVIREADSFTLDSFTSAGFKKSKEFSTETVPEADTIWYGFYSQRDVEIRFYSSHELARSAGADSAADAVGRSPNSNIGGGIITSTGNRTQYNDYLVVGNAVVLCQTDIDPCLELAELLEAG